jgi:hypothetical protein
LDRVKAVAGGDTTSFAGTGLELTVHRLQREIDALESLKSSL